MSTIVYGFVAEPHKNGYWLVSPATKEDDLIRCHDLSGFLGSWNMKQGGVFFPSPTNDSLCNVALQEANTFAREKI